MSDFLRLERDYYVALAKKKVEELTAKWSKLREQEISVQLKMLDVDDELDEAKIKYHKLLTEEHLKEVIKLEKS